jgi:3-dehydroquinate dehydratase
LLKAPHLRNSTNFTIVDLRENNIQNNATDVRSIIEHANTEAKYENVFLTIREEWEQSQLKIVPFKE